MDGRGTVVRWVGTGQISVLGGASWKSPGPEAIAAQRTWKEILGWNDSFEPADTEVRAPELE